MVTTRLYTVEDLEEMYSDEAERYEIFSGILREVEPVGARHGEVGVQLIIPLGTWVLDRNLGRIYTELTHFVFQRDPDIVLMPDVSFVRADRLPPEDERYGVLRLAPDLAVEILSPSNRAGEISEKVEIYLRNGVGLVWVVHPRRRTVVVHVPGREPETLGEFDTLDGGDVLPGFLLPVTNLFR